METTIENLKSLDAEASPLWDNFFANKSKENIDALVVHYWDFFLSKCDQIARKYRLDEDEFQSFCGLILMQTLPRYDPSKGLPFTAFWAHCVWKAGATSIKIKMRQLSKCNISLNTVCGDNEIGASVGVTDTTVDIMEKKEQIEGLFISAKLSPREEIVVRCLMEQSFEEQESLAEELDISLKQLSTTYERALRKLRDAGANITGKKWKYEKVEPEVLIQRTKINRRNYQQKYKMYSRKKPSSPS